MPTDTEPHKNKTQNHRHKMQDTNIQNTENIENAAHVKKILNERNVGMPLPTNLNTCGIFILFIQTKDYECLQAKKKHLSGY